MEFPEPPRTFGISPAKHKQGIKKAARRAAFEGANQK